jgi:hypothetical protein
VKKSTSMARIRFGGSQRLRKPAPEVLWPVHHLPRVPTPDKLATHAVLFAIFFLRWRLAGGTAWSFFCGIVPCSHFILSVLLHALWPQRSDMERFVRDVEEFPHYRDELEQEQEQKYTSYSFLTNGKRYVIVRPNERKHDCCVVWVAGFGRYFSHTSSRDDFKNADLLGLDLPNYGRAYLEGGIDEVGNEFNSVPPPRGSCTYFVDYYHDAYSDAIIQVKSMGYEKIVFMCNSTAGLTFQCFVTDVLSKRVNHPVVGVIYTAPFWVPRSPLLRIIPWSLWRAIGFLYPKLILFCDDVMPSKEPAAHDKRWIAAHKSGRKIYIDPKLCLSENSPYYVDWFCMVIEAQWHLKQEASKKGGAAGAGVIKKALLITSNDQENDKHVHLDEVNELFDIIFPSGIVNREFSVNHEVSLNENMQV